MAQTWNLKLAPPIKTLVGKFEDPVSLDKAIGTLLMYEDEEVIAEDSDTRKKHLTGKSKLVLEESKVKGGEKMNRINYRGSVVNTTTEEVPTKYVLLQVVKNIGNQAEMNMGDWYNFKKETAMKSKTLDDVDIEYENIIKQKASDNKRYARISKAMEGRAKLNEESLEDVDEDDSGSKWRVGIRSMKKLNKKLQGKAALDPMAAPSVYGFSASKSATSVSSSAAQQGFMNDGGVDVDAENEYKDMCGFEYEKTWSDNEEDVAVVQKEDEEKQMNLGTLARDIVDDDELDNDDESKEGESVEGGEGAEGESLVGGAVVKEDLLTGTKELFLHMQKQAEKKDIEQNSLGVGVRVDMEVEVGGGQGEGVKTGGSVEDGHATASGKSHPEKRKLAEVDVSKDDRGGKVSDSKRGKTSSASSGAGGAVSGGGTSGSASAGVGAVPSKSSRPLTEDNVRLYIQKLGGKVKLRDLAKEFKGAIDSMGEVGKSRFKEIVKKLTDLVDDSRLGSILVLKS